MTWLVRISTVYGVFGIIVGEDGRVIESAPIAKWTRGKRGRDVVREYESRNADIEIFNDLNVQEYAHRKTSSK